MTLQNNPSQGPSRNAYLAHPDSGAHAAHLHHNAPQQTYDKELMSASVGSSFKEPIRPFQVSSSTPGGLPMPPVVYNHSSQATPVSNVSCHLALHQQQVSHFEVADPSAAKADALAQLTAASHQGDTLMNLFAILGRAYLSQSKYHC